jgi:hypothetical protein
VSALESELAKLRAEVRDLRADVATLLRLARIFYEAGHDDALGIPQTSASKPPRRGRGKLTPVR